MKSYYIFLSVCLHFALSAHTQTGSEILLFDMKVENGVVTISNPVNITKHKGYDNQPFFHPSKPVIYYSSFDDSSRSDIKYYNYETKKTANLTITREREYSPTVTPDEKFISCIIQRDNGAQDLARYPIEGGKPQVLIDHLKIGYHAWSSQDKVILFVLGDSNSNTLHHYDIPNNGDTVIAENVGRSLHRIPGRNAVSFIQKVSAKDGVIKELNLQTGVIATVANALPGQDHLTWLQNYTLLMSDGHQLFSYHAWVDTQWQPVIVKGDDSVLKGVTRLAVNAANTKLAVVVSE